ncbi:MAG TPA: nuclear transport factor 2 family protein [Nevskiaceae bacterium]|nr:nuclear transport factor 2 family protein [Nevskiaceae bacterium]
MHDLPEGVGFRDLAERYAQAADRNRPALLDTIMADDVVLEGPGFVMAGLAEVRGFPAMLAQRFRGTRHLVHNQVIEVDGDRATGETYCTASHLLRESPQVLVWHLRYQDEFRHVQGAWRLARRRIVLDWTETRPVDLPEAP